MLTWLTSFFKSQPVTPEVTAKVNKLIEGNKVMVFSKSYCPYCSDTKLLLGKVAPGMEVVELNQVPDGSAMQQALENLTGQRTVPNIFINQKHIGGNSELQALHLGNKLVPMFG